MAPKPVEEAPAAETLKYQTWVLKVFIHCEGCKKKVKKVLQGIDGVYTTEIDSQQHKVKVTGNVDADTLIKKLVRSGKLAELLPEPKLHNKNNKSAKSKGHGGGGGKQTEELDQKNSEPVGKNDDDQKGSLAVDQDPNKDHIECDDEVAGGGGEGGQKKKKNKKKNNSNDDVNNTCPTNINGGHQESISEEAVPVTGVNVANPMDLLRHPLQQAYPYPPPQIYYSPSQAYQYGLSYNTPYPTSTSSSYYAPSMHANYTTYPRLPPPPPPSLPINLYHDHREYQGGCSIM